MTALTDAFTAKYGIKVDVWRGSSEDVLQRGVTETRAGRYTADVFETNGPELEALTRENVLQPISSPTVKQILPEAVFEHRSWIGTRLNVITAAYNTNLVDGASIPKKWTDFLDPQWKGKLGVEAADSDWMAAIVKRFPSEQEGIDFFTKLSETNGLSVRSGHTLLTNLVASGEVPLSMTVYQYKAAATEGRRCAGRLIRHFANPVPRERHRRSAQCDPSQCRPALLRVRADRCAGDPRQARLHADEHHSLPAARGRQPRRDRFQDRARRGQEVAATSSTRSSFRNEILPGADPLPAPRRHIARRCRRRRPATEEKTMLSVRELCTEYPDKNGKVVKAAQDVAFEIPEGKLFTLLGPSGCGKTTTLRSIAGLERPTTGTIAVDDALVFSSDRNVFVAPNQRNFGMVFQSYAIWPHMSVFENVAFPLRVGRKRFTKQEIEDRVNRVLVGRGARRLSPAARRPSSPAASSSGWPWRDALVMEPKLLLLDEPLSNLDAKLREKMRFELKRLQRELSLTTIYVTHDQQEALALSAPDRADAATVGSSSSGTPREIYERPASRFAADFVGTTSFIEATVKGRDARSGDWILDSEIGTIRTLGE